MKIYLWHFRVPCFLDKIRYSKSLSVLLKRQLQRQKCYKLIKKNHWEFDYFTVEDIQAQGHDFLVSKQIANDRSKTVRQCF